MIRGGPREERGNWSIPAKRQITSGLLLCLALLATGGALHGQVVSGKEATVPKTPPPPRRFQLNYEGSSRYLIRDGDPEIEDAPLVLAVAGGAKLWFDDYFLTAKNILIWIDPESLGNGNGVAQEIESDDFPHTVSSPLQHRPELDPAFAATSEMKDLPPNVTTGRIREVYAEGDVYITQGKTMILQGDKAYFNLIENRSLIVNAEIRTSLGSLSLDPEQKKAEGQKQSDKDRPAPIIIRAAEIRGVSQGLYEADRATVTTSTFAKPGYHIAMDHLVYEERALEIGGKITGYNNEFILGDVSLMSLPFFTIRTGVQSPVPLIGFSTGFSTRFGLFLETRWGNVFEDLGNEFNQHLGVEGPFKGDWFADVNLYSARGLGLGGGVKYETPDKYFGKTEFFWIHDLSGNDETSKKADFSGARGQFWTQNRIFLPNDWQFDAELNFISDRGFLKEFRRDQFKEQKAPETVAYLKKLDGDTAVTALARYRMNDWQSQTEYLPQATFDVISRPVAEFQNFGRALDQPEPVRLYWTHRSEVAYVNRVLSSKHAGGDAEGSALRVDNIDRLNMPFEINDFGFDPYFENRATMWMGDAERDGGGGGFREGMTVGFNANTQYTRTDPDLESEFWNVHGIRHIVIPTLRYRWTFLSTQDSTDLVPYDKVEHFDALHVLVPGITSRYQTKRMTRRGPETVTFLEFDLQQPFIFHNAREDDIDLLGDLHFTASWRPDLDTYLLRNSNFRTSANLNWNDFMLDTYRFEFRTEPGPDFYSRVAYSWSRRGRVSPTLALEGFAPRDPRDENLSALTLEFGYQATRLWEFVVVKQFDFGGGSGGETRIILRRRTHDWMFEFGIGAPSSGVGTGLGMTVTPIAFFRRDERDRYQSALSDGYDLVPIFDEPDYSTGGAFGSSQDGENQPRSP